MNENRMPTVVCRCGYEMDCCTNLSGDKELPVEGDASICLNCGAILTFDGSLGNFRTMTEEEQLGLPAEVMQFMSKVRAVRERVVTEDLGKKQREERKGAS